ncbi:MAG: TatD family deoxyribonuclease [Chloroflexota bacterium]
MTGAGASAEAPLVDAHCHLNHERFGVEAEAVAEAARAVGVVRLLVPGWNLASSERAVALARQLGWPDAAVGIHPHDAAKAGEVDWARIERLARDPAVVAIGETGLDYDRGFSPVEAQLENLARHLELAVGVGKPIVLHCRSKPGRRDAQDALLDALARWRNEGAAPASHGRAGDDLALGSVAPAVRTPPPAILHSFSGPPDYGLEALRLGCLISFSGLVFRAGEEASAEVARLAPEEAILVETDAPFLAPPGMPGRRNEPAWVAATARWLAELRDDDLRTLGRRLVTTYDRTFRRPSVL